MRTTAKTVGREMAKAARRAHGDTGPASVILTIELRRRVVWGADYTLPEPDDYLSRLLEEGLRGRARGDHGLLDRGGPGGVRQDRRRDHGSPRRL